ncbi:VOC family protein [Streptomyces sp. CBMA152]|uniref:VOC family protein n=1 Tax=Streptomyces sp. CBMA152 TaxID=1896312 RepID=UPI0016606454|nr:VOC family protein [Streptomyces sp. CBMA152]MBD0746376.1 hydrolase [Streptomyces sp. CBMA152]
MDGFPEGAPCWADVTLPDLAAGKRFYGALMGWTFDDDAEEQYGFYTNAFSGDKRVAALVPKRDGRMPTAWGVYFATPDAKALAVRIRAAGGQLVTDPVAVPPYGTMAVAADPGGAVFGLWQAGSHTGFEKIGEPGAFCWTEVYAREPEGADAFYEAVFGFEGHDLEGTDGDFRTWSPAGSEPGPDTAFGGRSLLGDSFPAEMPDHFLVYFAVGDCDASAAKCVNLGGRIIADPFDIPYGRMAVVSDDQGASFAILQQDRPVP